MLCFYCWLLFFLPSSSVLLVLFVLIHEQLLVRVAFVMNVEFSSRPLCVSASVRRNSLRWCKFFIPARGKECWHARHLSNFSIPFASDFLSFIQLQYALVSRDKELITPRSSLFQHSRRYRLIWSSSGFGRPTLLCCGPRSPHSTNRLLREMGCNWWKLAEDCNWQVWTNRSGIGKEVVPLSRREEISDWHALGPTRWWLMIHKPKWI